jgi:hypothetical protein
MDASTTENKGRWIDQVIDTVDQAALGMYVGARLWVRNRGWADTDSDAEVVRWHAEKVYRDNIGHVREWMPRLKSRDAALLGLVGLAAACTVAPNLPTPNIGVTIHPDASPTPGLNPATSTPDAHIWTATPLPPTQPATATFEAPPATATFVPIEYRPGVVPAMGGETQPNGASQNSIVLDNLDRESLKNQNIAAVADALGVVGAQVCFTDGTCTTYLAAPEVFEGLKLNESQSNRMLAVYTREGETAPAGYLVRAVKATPDTQLAWGVQTDASGRQVQVLVDISGDQAKVLREANAYFPADPNNPPQMLDANTLSINNQIIVGGVEVNLVQNIATPAPTEAVIMVCGSKVDFGGYQGITPQMVNTRFGGTEFPNNYVQEFSSFNGSATGFPEHPGLWSPAFPYLENPVVTYVARIDRIENNQIYVEGLNVPISFQHLRQITLFLTDEDGLGIRDLSVRGGKSQTTFNAESFEAPLQVFREGDMVLLSGGGKQGGGFTRESFIAVDATVFGCIPVGNK